MGWRCPVCKVCKGRGSGALSLTGLFRDDASPAAGLGVVTDATWAPGLMQGRGEAPPVGGRGLACLPSRGMCRIVTNKVSDVGEFCYGVDRTGFSPVQSHDSSEFMTDTFCVVVWFEGTSELVDWFDTKKAAASCAAAWNREAETEGTGSGVRRYGADDYFTVELAADWS